MKKISTATAHAIRKVESQRLTIGLDLGDRWSWYCVLDETGEVLLEQKLSTIPKTMREVFRQHSVAILPPVISGNVQGRLSSLRPTRSRSIFALRIGSERESASRKARMFGTVCEYMPLPPGRVPKCVLPCSSLRPQRARISLRCIFRKPGHAPPCCSWDKAA